MDKNNKRIKEFNEFCNEYENCSKCPLEKVSAACRETYKKMIKADGKINIDISKEMYKSRKVKRPAVYKHFKHNNLDLLNNYLYCTMFLAYPIKKENELNTEIMKTPKMTVIHTETNEEITLFYYDNKWNYINDDNEVLVIYKSLYDGSFPYARPIDMFLSEVDHNKYPHVTQKYRFELLEGEE